MTSFDDIVDELQSKITEETIDAYGQAGYDRWRNPPHRGKPEKTNYQGESTGGCGDTIWIFLHIEDDRVIDAGFGTDGCGSSTISASMAAELAAGKTCDEAAEITGEMVLNGLGKLPDEDQHCAWLAATALHEALGDYYNKTAKQVHKEG